MDRSLVISLLALSLLLVVGLAVAGPVRVAPTHYATVALCRTNGLEQSKLVAIRATTLEFASGTRVDAIAGGYADAAGGRHSLVIFDEVWGFQTENLRRLFEELTPPPSEPNAWTLIVS